MDIPDLKSLLGRREESQNPRMVWVGRTLNLIQFHPGCSKPRPARPWTLPGIPSFCGNPSQPLPSLIGKSFSPPAQLGPFLAGWVGLLENSFQEDLSFLEQRRGQAWIPAGIKLPCPCPFRGLWLPLTLVWINRFSPEPESKNTGTS